MRTLAKNKQLMKHALLIGEAPVYAVDKNGNRIIDYTEDDGIIIYQETGESELVYSTPQEFFANISMSGSEAEAEEYGLSISDYQAVIVYDKGAVPLTEGSLVWFKSEVENRYDEEMEIDIEDEKVITTAPKPISADYTVIKISESINFTKAILKAVNK